MGWMTMVQFLAEVGTIIFVIMSRSAKSNLLSNGPKVTGALS